jgi:hypothetical protein
VGGSLPPSLPPSLQREGGVLLSMNNFAEFFREIEKFNQHLTRENLKPAQIGIDRNKRTITFPPDWSESIQGIIKSLGYHCCFVYQKGIILFSDSTR